MKSLGEAIDAVLARKRSSGVFDATSCAAAVIEGLSQDDPQQWDSMRDQIVMAAVTATIQRRLGRLSTAGDDRQGWLALPEYERVPQLLHVEGGVIDINEATLDQYRESEAELRERIKSYKYPRRSPEKLKRDQQALRQMMKLDRRVAPLMAGDPAMTVGHATQLYQELRESPSLARKIKGGRAGGRGRKKPQAPRT